MNRRALALIAFLATPLLQAAPLIPREVLFGNPERVLPRFSPDGTQISWLAPDGSGVMNVWAQHGSEAPRVLTKESARPIFWYDWSGDGKQLFYFQNNQGDENDHLFTVDLGSGNIRDLTPFQGVRAQDLHVSMKYPARVLVALNLSDRKRFDMYRVDLRTGAIMLEAKNPGDVLTWTPDNDFVIRAATAFTSDGHTVIRVRDGAGKPWRDLVRMPFEQALFDGQVVGGSLIAGFDPDGKSLLVHSAMQSDKGRLVRVDLKSGAERSVVASDPDSDVANDFGNDEPNVIRHPITGAVQAVGFDYTTPHWKFIDPALGRDFARINQSAPGHIRLISRDQKDRKWIVSASASDKPTAYYSYDRETKKLTPLFTDNPALARYKLAPKKAVVIKARDGLPLVSYLTLPPDAEPKNLPMVLDIHGGPWYRWTDDYDPEAQLLANRGYAVLQVNYRGSTGYGIKFFNAGNNQWGRGMQTDLYDATRWAIEQGIADPKRIASMGASGGGYATLLALEQRPDLFAAGVDAVGPADVATLFRSFPAYWSNIMLRWRKRVGDVEHDPELNRAISPLYHVDAIKAPLLIMAGQNDVRVTLKNIDGMVKALRDDHRDVVYVVYPDEGHGWGRPENTIDSYARVEEFLARQIGGRAEPFVQVPGTSAQLR
ncbi:MAG TPA: S9 family peptidase [Thermoanaerobaculia bacterium]|nr:S9 family peptidase [Thermoanaerobaculia bacterium]